MSDFEKLINASDLIEWIMEEYPDWCVGAVRSIVDHVEAMPSATCDDCIWHVCNYNKVYWNGENDCISRRDAIDAVCEHGTELERRGIMVLAVANHKQVTVDLLESLPSAQPTLYGYKIEHLAYIAKVMEEEGVTADYAVSTFDDISRALRMIIDEVQERVVEALNERYDFSSGGD